MRLTGGAVPDALNSDSHPSDPGLLGRSGFVWTIQAFAPLGDRVGCTGRIRDCWYESVVVANRRPGSCLTHPFACNCTLALYDPNLLVAWTGSWSFLIFLITRVCERGRYEKVARC